MVYFILLFLEIAVLFLLSRKISQELGRFLSINILSFLFLPGVIIHELSHLLVASILLVPVGHMEFTPKKNSNGLKLGSVEIGKTDPIRRAIIGFAPIFAGIALILGLVYFVIELNTPLGISLIVLIFYILFAVSNTMFSSKRDMEGTIEIIVTLLIIAILLYLLGLRVPLSWIFVFLESNIELVGKSMLFLFVPIVIDFIILGTIKLIRR